MYFFGGILLKNTKKIGVFISLLLISIIALGAVSAADDVTVDDADVAAVEEVVVDDAPATNEIIDDSDSEDLQSASDTMDDVVADDVSPKDVLKAEALGAEPDGSFDDLTDIIAAAPTGSTVTLDRNYVYSSGDDTAGVWIEKAITIDGAGFTIDGKNAARPLRIATNGAVTLKNLNFVNGVAPNTGGLFSTQYRGGAILCTGGTTLTITNCTFENNRAGNVNDGNSAGGAIYIGSGRMTVTQSEFYNNRAYNGGAIYQPQNPTVTVKGCAIVNNTATGRGNFSYLATGADQRFDYSENWWGDNYGPAFNVYSERADAYLPRYDYYIATEILTSPITIEVNMVLDSGNAPTVPLESRHAIVTNDADTCNTTDGYVPEAFTIEFTTSNDAYINVTIDNQYLILKVFAGENKKNITLSVETADVTLPDQPVVTLRSDVDGIFNLTLGDEVYEVNVVDGVGVFDFAQEGIFVDVGKYTIIASLVDDPVYKTIFRTAEFEVKKYLNELTIEADKESYTFGDNVTITPTFTPEGPTGTITYFVDGATAGTELAVDEDLVLSGLAAGEHSVVAKYGGDGKYGESTSNNLTFTIAKAALEISVADVTVNYPNKGTVNVTANVDGKYNITVNDKDYEVTVVDGVGTFDVTEELAVGEYDIEWDIAESENYTAASGSATYKVDKTAPDFALDGDKTIDYGEANTITPSINEGAKGTITYTLNGDVVGTYGVADEVELIDLDAGHYTVVATYSGDSNYASAEASFEFDVLPIDVIVTVETADVAYPNTGSVNLTAYAPGTYTIKIGDKTYTAEITEEGQKVAVAIDDVFAVGKYPIAVTAPAHDNYKAVEVEDAAIYTVTKAQAKMTITYDAAADEFTVTLDGVDEKLSESYHILIDSEDAGEGATEDGVDTFDIPYPGAGKHSAFVIFDGNENYLGAYAQTSFDLPKLDTAVVTVDAPDIKEGENATITVTVKDGEKGLTGVVTVTLDDTDYALDVVDGVGVLTVQNLVSKNSPAENNTTYDIEAKFNGNDEYEPAKGTGTQLVQDWNPVIIVISSAGETAVATLVDTDLNNITGKVNVTIDDGEAKEYDCIDGKVDITEITEGTHDVTVSFPGDETHPAAAETATVEIGKKLIPVNLVLSLADITYTQNAEAVVFLTATDDLGRIIKLDGTVKVTIGNQVKDVTVTGGEGKMTFSGLNANSYNAIAEFESDGTYDYGMATCPLIVKQMKTRIIANNMTTTAINVSDDGRIGKWLTITLVDANGKAMANKKIAFGFNAKVYNKTTDANGKASLQINLQKAGDYTFAISYLGDNNYEGAFEVVKITVNKQKASMTASGATYKASAKTKTLTATLKDVAGNPMPEKKVTFTVNGKTYSAITDSKGVAKVNVSLTKAGSYSVEVKFAGTATYEALTRKVTLKLT